LEQARRREIDQKRWGPYLCERQWSTVREDYSETGDAWTYFRRYLLPAFARLKHDGRLPESLKITGVARNA
jgi:hypothetical protein